MVAGRQRRNEVEFNTNVAAFMPNPPIVRCHQAVYSEETGASHLIFDDASETHFQVETSLPPPLHQAGKAIDAFAELHAFWWDHQALGDVGALASQKSVAEHVNDTREHFPRFVDSLGDRLTASQRQVYERTLASLPGLMERVTQGKNLTLIHGDANSGGSNCLHFASIGIRRGRVCGCQTLLVRIIELRIVSSFRMQAVRATFLGLPASTRRW